MMEAWHHERALPGQAEAGNNIRVHNGAGGWLPRTENSRCSKRPALSVP